MMTKGRIIILLAFLLGLVSVDAQNSDRSPALILQARISSNATQLHWLPNSPADWKAQMPDGYWVSRVEIDASGNAMGTSVTVKDRILMRDQAWFSANTNLEDGLMEPIGALLYDSTFMFGNNELMDESTMKYNFIVYEASRSIVIAEAVGLGITDSNVEEGKRYRYEVTAIGGNLSGSIDVEVQARGFVQSPEDYVMAFDFPNDQSLSDMLAATRDPEIRMVRGLARAYGDSIVLRWGPSSARLWDQAKKDGYKVYRAFQDESPELIAEIFPWSKEDVTPDIANDSMALLAAAILYGDPDLVVREELSLFEQSSLFSNYYGFSLFAAERSPLAAEILGLRFVDYDVTPGAAYTYFVRTESLSNPILGARMLVVNEFEDIEPPVGMRVESQDKALRVVWDKDRNRKKFSAYRLERSSNNVDFVVLTSQPLVFIEDPRTSFSEFFYVDSVGVNGQPFYYQLSGLNSFGEWSAVAMRSGTAHDFTPPPAVDMVVADFIDSTAQFYLQWAEAGPTVQDLAHYQVLMSHELEGTYSAVSPFIDINQRSYLLSVGDLELDQSFYFKIQSEDEGGNTAQSTAQYVFVPDRWPPAAPETLAGIIDSTGLVEVAWEPSISEDVRGYWLYWSNYPDQEMSAVNNKALASNHYSWRIEDVSLNEKIYFCVRAEDDNYNLSKPSAIIEVQRPDHVPPIIPHMEFAAPDKGRLAVHWTPSRSSDAVWQLLYKRPESDDDLLWQLIDSLPARDTMYLDSDVRIGQGYHYRLRTIDDAGNSSDFSNRAEGKIQFPAEQVVVTELTALPGEDSSGELNWVYIPLNDQLATQPYHFDIYRSTGRKAVEFYRSVPADQFHFSDENLQNSVLYKYAIRVRYHNGWLGNLSPTKSVIIQ